MGSQVPPEEQMGTSKAPQQEAVKDVELLRVMVTREGQQVNAQWAIHPQMKHDLPEKEWKEVTDLMGQVTGIVGSCFSKILSEAEPDPPGNV